MCYVINFICSLGNCPSDIALNRAIIETQCCILKLIARIITHIQLIEVFAPSPIHVRPFKLIASPLYERTYVKGRKNIWIFFVHFSRKCWKKYWVVSACHVCVPLVVDIMHYSSWGIWRQMALQGYSHNLHVHMMTTWARHLTFSQPM